jgi:hypothetical protein
VICPFQTSTGLKGVRKLQGFGGIVLASSEGQSDSSSAITTGVFNGVPTAGTVNLDPDVLPGGTGKSFGNGNSVGTSNGFIQSGLGQALASGTSGGNSTAETDLTVLSMNDDGNVLTGGGLTGGILSSIGSGGGSAGGNAVFGPSLTLAIAAATPADAPPAPEVDDSSKNGNAAAADTPAAPTAPAFSFNAAGLPTGGGGGGFGSGSGMTNGFIASPDNVAVVNAGNQQFFADEAYGIALANGFGFGVGSGVAVNAGSEQAGGSGGGTALGQGQFVFELDDVQNANFANSGLTNSSGGAGAYVGFNPPAAQIFNAFITPPPPAVGP